MTTRSAQTFDRRNVHFPVEGGVDLSAWLFVSQRQSGPMPAIDFIDQT